MFPTKFEEHYLRVYVKDDKNFEAANYAYERFCDKFKEKISNEEGKSIIDSPIKDVNKHISQSKQNR